MKKVFTLLGLLLICFSIKAQYETVVFDYERNYFNQGQALPAESYFILSGQIQQSVELVEIELFRSTKKKSLPIYTSAWKRSYANKSESFEIPMNFKLKGGNDYDVAIKSYRRANDIEKTNLRSILIQSLNAYVDGIISVEKKRLDVAKPAGAVVQDLNDIVLQGTSFYRNKINFTFPGFSDIVKNKLKQINDSKLRKGIHLFGKEKAEQKRDIRKKYSDQLIGELKAALRTEISQLINSELLVLQDGKEVIDYPTEKTRNIISLNAGYGAVHFKGSISELEYDSSPFIGLSIPLGNAAFTTTFWSNASISAGVFIQNLTDENDEEVTGPIFGRPYYFGLGYKLFQFIRLNAGATMLETKREQFGFDISEVRVRPFVGVSAEINLWVGLGKK